MVIKLIGAVMLIIATFSAGYYKSKSLYRRRDFINAFIVYLNSLATAIRYQGEDIFEIAGKSACSQELNVFSDINNAEELSFEDWWSKCVLTIPKAYSLDKTDISLLTDFGRQLGKTDIDGQLKHIELYKVLFKKQLADAQDAISRKSKLYKTMGFFVGTAAALLMM